MIMTRSSRLRALALAGSILLSPAIASAQGQAAGQTSTQPAPPADGSMPADGMMEKHDAMPGMAGMPMQHDKMPGHASDGEEGRMLRHEEEADGQAQGRPASPCETRRREAGADARGQADAHEG